MFPLESGPLGPITAVIRAPFLPHIRQGPPQKSSASLMFECPVERQSLVRSWLAWFPRGSFDPFFKAPHIASLSHRVYSLFACSSAARPPSFNVFPSRCRTSGKETFQGPGFDAREPSATLSRQGHFFFLSKPRGPIFPLLQPTPHAVRPCGARSLTPFDTSALRFRSGACGLD